MDHRSPEFAALTREILPKLRAVFGTEDGAIVLYPSSGTGAWEAGLVNVLAPGDRVLSFNSGYFSAGFAQAARNLGLVVDEVPLRWGQEVPAAEVEARLRDDTGPGRYRAVLIVHNETSTGVLSDLSAIRRGIDAAAHDALLIVDAVSSLASVPFCFDDWGVDIGLAASQKGLMLPPGLAIVCASQRALMVGNDGGAPRHFFDWAPIIRDNASGFFPYTPATQLLVGLRTALEMLVDEEGLEEVFARHRRLADGVRASVNAWGLGPLCEDPQFASQTLTAVVVPHGVTSGDVVAHARNTYGLSLGIGLGLMKDRTFRIGHVGSLDELEVLGIVAAVEMSLAQLEIDVRIGAGAEACERSFLTSRARSSQIRPSVGILSTGT